MPALSRLVHALNAKNFLDAEVKTDGESAEACFQAAVTKGMQSFASFQQAMRYFGDIEKFSALWEEVDSNAKDFYVKLVTACEQALRHLRGLLVTAARSLAQKLEDFLKTRLDNLAAKHTIEDVLAALDSSCKVVTKDLKGLLAPALNSSQAKELYKDSLVQ